MPESKFGPHRLLSILFFAVFALLLAVSISSRPAMVFLYAHTSFYLIAALCALWVYSVTSSVRLSGFRLPDFFRTYYTGIMLSLGMTVIVFVSVPVCFKMLNDETNLLAVSQSMFYFRDAFRISMADNHHGFLYPIVNEIPIRPLLYPFATFLLHVITGYDWHNPFVLNFFTMFIFLCGIYIVSTYHTDTWTSCAAVILVCSYPIFTIYGTSGSYDLFSALFFFLSMTFLYRFLDSPDDTGFTLLWTTLLMFANIRYESIIFFVLIIAVVLLSHGTRLLRKNFYIYTLTPLLMLPYVWQRLLSIGEYENPPGVSLFSIKAFFIHIRILINNFLNLDFFLPYNGILNLAVVLCAGFLAALILQKKIIIPKKLFLFWGTFISCITIMMAIFLSHYLGLYDNPNQARLFLCFSITCALAPVLVKCAAPFAMSGRKLFSLSVILFMLYHPVASKHEFINTLLTIRIQNQAKQVLKKYRPQKVLILSAWSGQYSARNYSSLSIQYANSHISGIRKKYRNHRYEKIIIFQEIDMVTGTPRYSNQVLAPDFKTSIINETAIMPDEILRISEADI
ncbi:MAG: hypothetical protein GXP53_04475 [Deltaproteobacteria bacterium]|nr:hypothetical protein [Deltaproteobacteria bacterium]